MGNKVIDIDLDVLSYVKNKRPEGEGVIFIRAWEDGDGGIQGTSTYNGDINILTNALLVADDLRPVIMLAAAFLVVQDGLDIEEYKEMVLLDAEH